MSLGLDGLTPVAVVIHRDLCSALQFIEHFCIHSLMIILTNKYLGWALPSIFLSIELASFVHFCV